MALSNKGLIQYNFENREQIARLIVNTGKKIGDLRFPFGEISRDFYKSERAIFKLKGPGGFPDLAPDGPDTSSDYKSQKLKAVGFLYPILRRSGKMEKALTTPNSSGSINVITSKLLIIGASVMSKGKKPIDIVAAHNSDGPRSKLPQRKVVFVGPEVAFFNSRDRANKGGRLTRWGNIIENYAQVVLKSRGLA